MLRGMNAWSTCCWSLALAVALMACSKEEDALPPAPEVVQEVQLSETDEQETACEPVVTDLTDAMTPELIPIPTAAGTDEQEHALALVEEAARDSEDIFFWATYDQTKQVFRLSRQVDGTLKELVFKRSKQASHRARFDIVNGQMSDFFPNVDPLHLADSDALFAAYSNPNGLTYTEHGYEEGEARMGFLSQEATSYPLAFERIASLFQSSHAPDVIVEFKPDAKGGPGTHGSLDLLQSRAALVLGGAGVKQGIVLDDIATLTDVAPTVLAAMGAPTTAGKSLLGTFEDGLYLKRQDGRVLHEALALDSCNPAQRAVIIVLDGLMASELNHQLLSSAPDVDLPHMGSIASTGSIYRGGATSPWPSFSAPGHMTIGTGVWSGHHGIVSNSVHDRETRSTIGFFEFISNPQMLLEDSSAFLKIYEELVHPDVETLAQAVHRGFGDWQPETGNGAFVAVLNDLPILGADRTSFDLISPTSAGFNQNLDLTSLADDFALNQALELLEDNSLPTPKLLQLSLYTTDKAGEAAGPHSNLLRKALSDMDARIGELIAAYKGRNAFKDTLWVLVADHGMALQDSSKPKNFSKKLSETGLKFWSMTGMIYLRTLALNVSMNGLTAQVGVSDHGNNQALSGVTVTCSGCNPNSATTDEKGTLTFQLPAGALVEFEAKHPEYNPQTETVGTPFTE